jgi:hypothetical protein
MIPALRRSLLLALPFQLAAIALAVLLSMFLPHIKVGLTVLLAAAMWAPALSELVLRTRMPWALQVHYLAFMFAGPFFGSALGVYTAIPDWDTLVHFDSGIMLAWLGMLFVRNAEDRIGTALPLWFAIVVIQATPMAFAAAWEISEYASDVIIGTASQRGGLEDTMTDIVAGTLGGMAGIGLLAMIGRPRSLAPRSLVRSRRVRQIG